MTDKIKKAEYYNKNGWVTVARLGWFGVLFG
jgi:hypothetical protein